MAEAALCELCGNKVDLDSLVTMTVGEVSGEETHTEMTERLARELLSEAGLPQPPVICERHEGFDWSVEIERDRP